MFAKITNWFNRFWKPQPRPRWYGPELPREYLDGRPADETPEEADAEFEWAARLVIALTLLVFVVVMVCLALRG